MDSLPFDALREVCKDLNVQELRKLGSTSRFLNASCRELIAEKLQLFAEEAIEEAIKHEISYIERYGGDELGPSVKIVHNEEDDTFTVSVKATFWDLIDGRQEKIQQYLNKIVQEEVIGYWRNFGFTYNKDFETEEDWNYDLTFQGADSNLEIGIYDRDEAIVQITSLLVKLGYSENDSYINA